MEDRASEEQIRRMFDRKNPFLLLDADEAFGGTKR